MSVQRAAIAHVLQANPKRQAPRVQASKIDGGQALVQVRYFQNGRAMFQTLALAQDAVGEWRVILAGDAVDARGARIPA